MEPGCTECGSTRAELDGTGHNDGCSFARRALTPEAFIASCRTARPTKHLHGKLSQAIPPAYSEWLAERANVTRKAA